jgi:chemotaxis methyl-accepting protein methylase
MHDSQSSRDILSRKKPRIRFALVDTVLTGEEPYSIAIWLMEN